jgi:hypothetical protein
VKQAVMLLWCRDSHIHLKLFGYTNSIVLEDLDVGEAMLKSFVAVKKEKPRVFQVLLLDNDDDEDVEVQEAEQVDFVGVEKHLAHGGSVFITSKRSQKVSLSKDKKRRNRSKTRKVKAFYLNQV